VINQTFFPSLQLLVSWLADGLAIVARLTSLVEVTCVAPRISALTIAIEQANSQAPGSIGIHGASRRP
jgi:hypothetical protein